MSLTELLPSVRALPKADKLRLMQVLVADVSQEEGVGLLQEGESYPIWSPYDSFEAAETLLQYLEKEKVGVA